MRYATIAAALTLAGCATTINETMNGIMSSWQGEHIDQVVARWGYPNEQREFEGRKLYVWRDSQSLVLPGHSTTTGSAYAYGRSATYYGTTTTTPPTVLHGQCERTLEVDQHSRVARWQWAGNNCCIMAVGGRCGNWPNPLRNIPKP